MLLPEQPIASIPGLPSFSIEICEAMTGAAVFLAYCISAMCICKACNKPHASFISEVLLCMQFATEAAITILRIDDMIRIAKAEEDGMEG